ncbi:MAG: hypothetical protein K2J20_05710, partial [Bacilli bacterium]|nr:hypothetical protein [Bacilli bacterium]
MKRVKNELLKKEFQKVRNNLIIGIVFAVLSMVCYALYLYDENRTPKDTVYLNDVITEQKNAVDIKANLKIAFEPYTFAKYNDEANRAFYIVYDGEYYYIAYMTDRDYDKLKEVKDIDKNPQTVYGVTKKIDSKIKKLALEAYNEAVKEENKITYSDFEKYFGGVYLDMTEESATGTVLILVGAISALCSFSFLIVYASRTLINSKALKKISDEELEKIEKELDDKETFHYEKAHLILTKNYIISLTGKLLVLSYKDILWMYEHRLRQYGITTQKSLMVMDTLGKIRAIVQVDGVTKKSTSI